MKNQKYKSVTRHNGQFTFQLSYLGQPLRPNEHWENEEDAACAADLTKHYFKENFFIDLPRSLDPEIFNTMAYRLNVVLSDCLSVESALPPGVKEFVLKHRDALNKYAETNKPERTPWAAIRANPDAMSAPMTAAWVVSCERAEMDAQAFAALNGKYLSLLMDGISNRATDILRPVSLALKMHSGVTNEKLVERLRLLVELESHLQATRAHIEFLALQFAEQQQQVASALTTLEQSRPAIL